MKRVHEWLLTTACVAMSFGSSLSSGFDGAAVTGAQQIDCDTTDRQKKSCDGCAAKVYRCVARSGEEAPFLCTSEGGAQACTGSSCVSTNHDTVSSNCKKKTISIEDPGN